MREDAAGHARCLRRDARHGYSSLFRELRRRHVFRVAAAYAVIGWLLIQITTQVFPVFAFPNWIEQPWWC